MAKIVINISDDTYYRCKNERVGLLPFDVPGVCYAIANGTVLPKGHGALKDVDDLTWAKHIVDRYGYEEDIVVSWDEIENAPTIIEADKEDEDADSN